MSRADTLEPRFEVVAETGGWPNGIAINRDGSLWVADYRGCCASIPLTAALADQHAVTEKLGHRTSESFKGLNDLTLMPTAIASSPDGLAVDAEQRLSSSTRASAVPLFSMRTARSRR